MSLVRIVPPKSEDGKPVAGYGTEVWWDGRKLPYVVQAVVKFSTDSLVEAELTVLADCEEIWAEPFMSEESFLAAAERYGYEVTKK